MKAIMTATDLIFYNNILNGISHVGSKEGKNVRKPYLIEVKRLFLGNSRL